MVDSKKKIVWVLVIIVLFLSIYTGFYLAKKYVKRQENMLKQASIVQPPALPGLERDSDYKIPALLPKELVLQEEIAVPFDSFTYIQQDKRTQYTYKYLSTKSLVENKTYYEKFFTTTPGWTLGDIFTDSTTFVSIRAMNKSMELMVSINLDSDNKSVVDITAIK